MGIGAVGHPAVFLDRDGVLNCLVLNPATRRMESPLAPEDFRLMPGVIQALQRLQSAGYRLILVSNQPNYALGKSSYLTLGLIHHRLVTEFVAAGIHFARFCYCLHHPKGVTVGFAGPCMCRKPSPWFLLRAAEDLTLSLGNSWMIGDQSIDIQCGWAAGVRTIRILEDGEPEPVQPLDPQEPRADFYARNLAGAVDIILNS